MQSSVRWPRGQRARWGVPPPLLAVPFWQRLRIVSTDPEQLVIVSHQVEETKTHFVDGRTCGCTGDQGECWLDHRLHGGGRYEAWLAVFSPKWRRNYLLSLTKVAVHQEPRLRLPDYDLRGRVLMVSRKYAGVRAPMRCALRDDPPREGGLDAAPDLRTLVERLWQAEDRHDDGQGGAGSPRRPKRPPAVPFIAATSAAEPARLGECL